MDRIALLAVVSLMVLAACGGGDSDGGSPFGTDSTDPTASADGATPTLGPTRILRTPPPPAETSLDASSPTAVLELCDLVEASEVEDVLGEFVSGTLSIGNCKYETDVGSFVRIEPGSPDYFDPSAEFEGVAGEAVPDIADEAVWFPTEIGVLSVRQDNAYFVIAINLRNGDTPAELEAAQELAAIALTRIP